MGMWYNNNKGEFVLVTEVRSVIIDKMVSVSINKIALSVRF